MSSPYFHSDTSVRRVMLTVCAALLPGILVYSILISPAILIQLLIASATALAFEALLLFIREKQVGCFVTDGSALITAWLIALSFPPLGPWWLIVVGSFFAIVVAKHLYGGLGQNPFNPAMVGFAVCIISYPAGMSQGQVLSASLSFIDHIGIIFGFIVRPETFDALSTATPLDALKTALKVNADVPVDELLKNKAIYGYVAGRGWEFVALAYGIGGIFLWVRKIITWHVPLAFLGMTFLLSGALWLFHPQSFANPLFHLFSGGVMLGAFFIATDPVSGCTTHSGKLIFGAFVGLLAYIIRVFGGYPDGVAFAVLLMNVAAPLIDRFTQPLVFGADKKARKK